MNNAPNDTKKLFSKCGTCSHTFFHLLNREFGCSMQNEERAADPLAGGQMNTGHQCGMLWGSALAVGADSFRRHRNHQADSSDAIGDAVASTRNLVESFIKKTGTPNCREITGCDLSSIAGMVTFGARTLLKGISRSTCFVLAEQWTPDALLAARQPVSSRNTGHEQSVSCASETVKKMGATQEEIVMVAGFAGGLGLSGNGCGALSAAIWMKTLAWCKAHPEKTPPYFRNKHAKDLLRIFRKTTGSRFLCSEISGKRFNTIQEHSDFIHNGGCASLIDALAR